MLAKERLSAAFTGNGAVIAAAVKKQDRLLSLPLGLFECLVQPSADGRGVSCAKLLSHIHDLGFRKQGAAVTLGKRNEGIFPRFCLVIAFDRRRRRGKHRQSVMHTRAVCGNVSCMVSRRGIGFIGMLMLLVDHDQS